MTTTLTHETGSRTAVVEPVAVAQAAAVDVSAVPETPADLLKQWDATRRPLLHTVVAAAFVRLWDALTGPAMTERDRLRRDVTESKGFADAYTRCG